jgi:calcineurin-like phosphoesterase family protein
MPSSRDLSAILDRERPGAVQDFFRQPYAYLAKSVYALRPIRAKLNTLHLSPVTVVCISDTHNHQPRNVPEGDILIHAGDLTNSGSFEELQAAVRWLNSLPHAHKVIVAGNHDRLLDRAVADDEGTKKERRRFEWGNVVYLQDQPVSITCSEKRRLNIFGSPWSPKHGNWAFQYVRSYDRWKDVIPSDIDILVTHTPPMGHLDVNNSGCQSLLDELWRLKRKPCLHICGHIHAGYGKEWLDFDGLQRAYERVVIAKGGIFTLLWFLCQFVIFRIVLRKSAPTLLVNASYLGGLRDEKKRDPIVVEI